MFWAEQWKNFARWYERLPLWVQIIVVPPFLPAVGALAAACVSPLTAAVSVVAGTILAVVYGLLLRQGILNWEEIGKQLGLMYLLFVVSGYLGMGEHLTDRLLSKKPIGSRKEPEAASSLDIPPDRDQPNSSPPPGG